MYPEIDKNRYREAKTSAKVYHKKYERGKLLLGKLNAGAKFIGRSGEYN